VSWRAVETFIDDLGAAFAAVPDAVAEMLFNVLEFAINVLIPALVLSLIVFALVGLVIMVVTQ